MTDSPYGVFKGYVKKFNSSGTYTSSFDDGYLDFASEIVIDSSGNAFVTSTKFDPNFTIPPEGAIKKFNSLGGYVSSFGGGSLTNLTGLVFDSKEDLFVVDYGEGLVKKFTSVPEPSTLALIAGGLLALLPLSRRRRPPLLRKS